MCKIEPSALFVTVLDELLVSLSGFAISTDAIC